MEPLTPAQRLIAVIVNDEWKPGLFDSRESPPPMALVRAGANREPTQRAAFLF